MAQPPFPIISVDEFPPYREEDMGTKRKHWFVREEPLGTHRLYSHWLFKHCQEGTGQDWAEKLACELAETVRLPHARVELASYQGHRGCIVKSVLTSHARDVLVHGNELLWALDPMYEKDKRNPSSHTVDRVLTTLDEARIGPPRSFGIANGGLFLSRASEWFVGYLMLDALIGNTDRHHENWAIIQPQMEPDAQPARTLAPSFDHGSSLSRELLVEEHQWRLREGWKRAGVVYANRAKSGLYESQLDKRPVHPLKAFQLAASQHPEAARGFVEHLKMVDNILIDELIERIPEERMKTESKRFVAQLIRHNRDQILEVGL
jgi:hypothetical protein